MRLFLITLMVFFCSMACAEQVWVKADATIEKKVAPTAFVVTAKMKGDLLKLDEITLKDAQIVAAKTGKGSIAEAKQVIEEMLKDETIVTKESRYSTLFPSAVELGP